MNDREENSREKKLNLKENFWKTVANNFHEK